MPVSPKNERHIHYPARLDGLRAPECVELADRLASHLGIGTSGLLSVNFDLPSYTFQGPLGEAREAFPPAGTDNLVNAATLTITGESSSGPRRVTVSASPPHALVSVTVHTLPDAEIDPVIDLVKTALPPMFPDGDAEQQRWREIRLACEDIAGQAAEVAQMLQVVREHAAVVERRRAQVEGDHTAAAEAHLDLTALLGVATELHASMLALHEEAKTANQDVADKQVKFTAVVNNANDFLQRIEVAEQRSRTTVEEVQARSAAALGELQTKAAATISDLQAENAALATRHQAESDAALADVEARLTRALNAYGDRTQALVTANELLQVDVRTLLQGATAGQLHLAFKERQRELEKTQGRWLVGLVLNTLAVVGAGMWLVHDFAALPGSELGLVAIKATVVLPLAILDIFIATQYTHRRALIEEYAFKASICASLMPFKDLVANQSAEGSTQKFVLDAVDRIYTNPSDAVTRSGPATRQIKRAMKVLQDTGVLDLAKSAAEKAKS